MTNGGTFGYKYRIIYGLIGFGLFHLTFLSVILLNFIGASSVSYLIYRVVSAPENLLPGEGQLTMFLTMSCWGTAGFILGYVKDRLRVAKVKTIWKSDRNKKIKNPYIDKIIKNPATDRKKNGYTLRDWIIIISTILCASLIAFIVIIPKIMYHLRDVI